MVLHPAFLAWPKCDTRPYPDIRSYRPRTGAGDLQPARESEADGLRLEAGGSWTVTYGAELDRQAVDVPAEKGGSARFDLRGIDRMDTAGAWMLVRLAARLKSRESQRGPSC